MNLEKTGRGPFFGSFVLALATILFNFLPLLLDNSIFSIFQTITLILFIITAIYTFTETAPRSIYRRLSWILTLAVFGFNVIISFLSF
ncbi:hypothetical protein ACNAN0_00330 [Agrilactobacillus fermenti]|uniref:hypothetical protein n=1 Tax=Agrilactobacillus fermenti TaxID=2586909 RepID=UPI001E5E8564|nr:hypothetical protein [Agrilactobacillus fermenti]MCD2256160.1 hypothetical protein [Agrilactobacillus fermenti]